MSADPEPFSVELESWLRSPGAKTLRAVEEQFGRRSFAIVILLLMAVPALPLPTGGISHLMEVLAILVALGLVARRDRLWLPRRWQERDLAGGFGLKAVGGTVRFIRFFERVSRPRGTALFRRKTIVQLLGLVIIGLALSALLAPPFSGLDTLPSLGVVIVCLAIILEDVVLLAVGVCVGSLGVALILTVGTALFGLVKSWIW